MTTIIADFRLGVMVADSNISDGNRVWIGRKVFRCKGALLGFAGDVNEAIEFMAWWKRGCTGRRPAFSKSEALVMTPEMLLSFNCALTAAHVKSGIETIGTGGKAAICAYEALAFTDPVLAVKLACKHDAESRGPVRVYRMKP